MRMEKLLYAVLHEGHERRSKRMVQKHPARESLRLQWAACSFLGNWGLNGRGLIFS